MQSKTHKVKPGFRSTFCGFPQADSVGEMAVACLIANLAQGVSDCFKGEHPAREPIQVKHSA
jgi:hypothetical protein